MTKEQLKAIIDGLFVAIETKTANPFAKTAEAVVNQLVDANLDYVLAYLQSSLKAKGVTLG